jgi:hypothetical protein
VPELRRNLEADAGEADTRSWRECRASGPEEGSGRSLREVSITKDRDFGLVNVLYHWAESEEEPRRLVTNLSPGFRVARLHRRRNKRRMWIEELFGDWQEGTFHFRRTRLQKPEKLSRLILGLSLVYVWLVSVASYVAGARMAPSCRPHRPSRSKLLGPRSSMDQEVSPESGTASNAPAAVLLKTVR